MGERPQRFGLSERIRALALLRRRSFRWQCSACWAPLLVLGLVGSAGCQKGVSPDELGTPVFKADELPGAGTTYERAEMSPPPLGESEAPEESLPPASPPGPG